MGSSVTRLSRKLHATKFGGAYPRFERPGTVSPARDIAPEVTRFIASPAGYDLFVAPPPRPNWIPALDLNAQEFVHVFNQILIYRTMKLLHGVPDIVSALVAQGESTSHPIDWSFTLSLDAHTLCEVRSKHYSRVHLVFWTPRVRSAEKKSQLGAAAVSFCRAMNEFLEKNAHLWDEDSDLETSDKATATVNVAAEKYESAERLLSAAISLDQRPDLRPIPLDDPLAVVSVGYLYAAAATQFFVAVEALVNLLYTLLLRPEFRSRAYERLTVRSEIDLRLVSMHVFCDGFARQAISPGGELWTRLVELRNFRNDLVHGNVTDEHRIHTLTEDRFMFFYAPSTDFRGRKLEAKAAGSLPRAQTRITRQTVQSIKKTVDELRSSLLGAMDRDTNEWVSSWLSEPLVQPRNKISNSSI